jgi:hypothetical protein
MMWRSTPSLSWPGRCPFALETRAGIPALGAAMDVAFALFA